jgi:malonate decarboxylase gamma subunit
MYWQDLADALFPQGHTVTMHNDVLTGSAQVDGETVSVIGTTGHAAIGVEIALAQAQAVLRTVREAPGRPIVLLVDTQGQRLRHRDEMLGINSYMAHLGKCVDLARRQGHKIIGLVYDQALSGGFITSGLMADACYALPDSTIRVMALPAMARITKVPEEVLTELARSNPVFAPGPENYLRMGGVQAIWQDDQAISGGCAAPNLADHLAHALREAPASDQRAALGQTRGGRRLAQQVIDAVMNDDHVRPA